MDRITLQDLAVRWRVGVTEEERARPQKLLLTIGLDLDTAAAAGKDDLSLTLDYFALAGRVRQWGDKQSWNLIETAAADVAQLVLAEFKPAAVEVEIKKFVLADAAHVSIKITRQIVRRP